MRRLNKQEEVEYRGKTHRCVYFAVSALELVIPTLTEMAFRKALLADEETMAYNRAYGGTIDFSEDRWEAWYQKWVEAEAPHYYYRYLYSRALETYVGEAAYHYEAETGRYLCDVIVHAQYRGRGFGGLGLALLCEAAKGNGIKALYDDIALGNPAIRLFLKYGFEEMGRTDTAYIVRKRLR